MKLSKRSWHYRLYKWYLQKEPPYNLCPYFWQLFFMTVGAPFIFAWSILYEILLWVLRMAAPKWYKDEVGVTIETISNSGLYSEYIVGGVVTNIACWLFYQMIIAPFLPWIKRFEAVHVISCLLWAGAIFIFLRWRWIVWRDRKREEYLKQQYAKGIYSNEPRPSIVKEFIKAKYKRHCPIIKWED